MSIQWSGQHSAFKQWTPHMLERGSVEEGFFNHLPTKTRRFSQQGPVALGCQEQKVKETFATLYQAPSRFKCLHIGVGFQMNYNILAMNSPDVALVLDRNNSMYKAHEAAASLILKHESAQGFVAAMSAYAEANSEDYIPADPHNNSNCAWHISEEAYGAVRNMYQEGRVKHLNADLLNETQSCALIARWAKVEGYTLETVYTSTLQEEAHLYGTQINRDTFKANLKSLATVSWFNWVHAHRPHPHASSAEQKVDIIRQNTPDIPDIKYGHNKEPQFKTFTYVNTGMAPSAAKNLQSRFDQCVP